MVATMGTTNSIKFIDVRMAMGWIFIWKNGVWILNILVERVPARFSFARLITPT